jgi:hypothetical protein
MPIQTESRLFFPPVLANHRGQSAESTEKEPFYEEKRDTLRYRYNVKTKTSSCE